MRLIHRAAGLLWLMLFVGFFAKTDAQAGNIYTSPYVNISPDGKAWTTNAGEKGYAWYERGTTVNTGIPSTLRKARQGEHYYKAPRNGTVPVGEWKVVHPAGICIHDDYPEQASEWHGVDFGRKKCMRYYYSGWFAYCADCGELIVRRLHYMSREAAETICYLDAGTGMDYYYLCPWCSNLEIGSGTPPHICSAISWNRYKVRYDANTGERYGGYMADSIHMYNDGTEYEGEQVTPLQYLTVNAYSRIGYEFAGWNTMPDGSGDFYEDGARILNLTDENYTAGSIESGGVVILYAMWRPSLSALTLNLNGGWYDGRDGFSVAGKYGESYAVDDRKVTAPSGCEVSFEANGGEDVPPITASQHFQSWRMEAPFQGRFQDGVYQFLAPDGKEDILSAYYEPDAIKLPEAVFAGKSFGGWYYDPELKQPAGEAGDFLIFHQDTTLYAKWADLRLWAQTNDKANGGKGAVDLRWLQPDEKAKAYMVYQSRDGEVYAKINSAGHISNESRVSETYEYAQSGGTYTVPYTGFYELTAEGAAGGDYGEYAGGKGGRVTAGIWLDKGEVVTYSIGGQDGGNGGGRGSDFAGGGGRSVISTDKKGIVLIAGGGGGADLFRNGESGGSSLSLRSDLEWRGEDGQAGGGAGEVGGSAGELVRHQHTEDCYQQMETDILAEYADYRTSYVYEYDEDGNEREVVQYGESSRLIPVQGAAMLEIELLQGMLFIHNHGGNNIGNSYLAVYNQSGEPLFYRDGRTPEDYFVNFTASYGFDDNDDAYLEEEKLTWGSRDKTYWIRKDGEGNLISQSTDHPFVPSDDAMENARLFGGTTCYSAGSPWFGSLEMAYKEKIAIPQGTTGIYIVSVLEANDRISTRFYQAHLSGGKKLICGYEEGQIVSSRPAYGGSNYINRGCCINYHSESGTCKGNGRVEIASQQIGFVCETELEGVEAPDLAAPDEIAGETVSREVISEERIRLHWDAPADNGTGYYHQVESYLAGTPTRLCRSNITYNVLAAGILGYYYLIDYAESTEVAVENAGFIQNNSLEILMDKDVKFLHIAPVDRAGNLGKTTHISINPLQDNFKWRLYTEKLYLKEGDNIYPADAQDTYYVKSDGQTPFTLIYAAGMEGWPREDYWLKYAVFEESGREQETRNILAHKENGAQTGAVYSAEGSPLLTVYPSAAVTWQEACRKQEIHQKFTLDASVSGRTIPVFPRAEVSCSGADYPHKTICSEYDADRENGLVLIADGEAPVIHGVENLELPEFLDRSKGSVILEMTAEDALSGVADFGVEIANQDNFIEKSYVPDGSGRIQVNITADNPVFSGDFTITAWAVDHVGNKKTISFGTTEFGLKAEVVRILPPQDPVFRRGESGILKFSVWGYADYVEVEFPEEMLAQNPGLNQVFHYENLPDYCHEEELQFMVPLDTPENNSFTITVRAYKKDRRLEEYPAASVIGVCGTVLDDIRTRLR